MFLTLLLSSFLTFVELNCENLFDTHHDAGKEDTEFLSDGTRHWTSPKYWGKLNRIGQEILSCSEELPDLVALIEVENDSVLRDLTHRSLLRNAGYQYLMTESPDQRGVDVALLYQPARFRLLCYDYLEVPPLPDMRPTRDILYVQGCCPSGDTLHVFVLHSPSRYGGERSSRPNRLQVIRQLRQKLAELGSSARVIITGDFNDYCDSPALLELYASGLQNVTCEAVVIMVRHAAPIAIVASGIPWIIFLFRRLYIIRWIAYLSTMPLFYWKTILNMVESVLSAPSKTITTSQDLVIISRW